MSLLLPDPRLLVATAATALAASLALALSTPAALTIDGQRVVSDVAPVTTPGGAFVPLRPVAEAAGAQVAYDAATGEIVVRRGVDVLVLRPGATGAWLNGHRIRLAHAPFTVHRRLMIGPTTVATAFGSSVRFDAKRNRVAVHSPGVVVAGAADDEP